jgi:Ca2+-binding RTX toxin-like protein
MTGRTHPCSHPARARLRRTVAALVAAGAVAAVLGPASADAATTSQGVFSDGTRLDYDAAPGENNVLVVSERITASGTVVVRFDDVVPITPLASTVAKCVHPDPFDKTVVECNPTAAGQPADRYRDLRVQLDDGENVLRSFSGSLAMTATGNGGSRNDFDGGPGTDRLEGAAGRDILLGGSGDDVLLGFAGDDGLGGGPGRDRLLGGLGNDRLNGNTGPDEISGDTGLDLVSYSDRSAGIKVTIDQLANDGETGEGDNVRPDVENVEGGNGNDEIIDQFGAGNAFLGRGGNDKLIGGPGADQTLVGGPGDDTIDGGAGADMLFGGDGFDSLKGGTENDQLFGEAGSLDTLDGGPGADVLSGGDGFDIVSYLSATQRVTVDLDGQAGDDGASGEGDTVRSDIEQLNGGPASDTLTGNASNNEIIGGDGNDVIDGGLGADNLRGGNDNDTIRAKDGIADSVNCGADSDQVDADQIDTQTGCEAKAAPAVGIGPKRARIDKQGRVKLTLHCWATAVKRCTGTLTLQRATGEAHSLGSRRFTVASADTATVRVRLDRRARRAIASKKLRVRAITRSRDGAGHKWTSKRTLTLVR